MLESAGVEAIPEVEPEPTSDGSSAPAKRRVVPQSIISRQLANPFLAPDLEAARQVQVRPARVAAWELLGPLLRSFEVAGSGATSCMVLPEPSQARVPEGLRLMEHQAQLVAAAAAGHRTFLLADEPGLGKTAQALLAAQAANAYPLLVVVPNVVKANWVREVGLWTPQRSATAIHGDGETIDGFADIVIVNYEVLDRHVGWLGDFGFRGMVVDEAHFIKNKSTQRSQHVREISERIRTRSGRPLLMALTGHAVDQRPRGLPGDLAVPRLDRRDQAAGGADGRRSRRLGWFRATPASTGRPAAASSRWASSAGARSTWPPTSRLVGWPTSPSSSTVSSVAPSGQLNGRSPAAWWRGTPTRMHRRIAGAVEGIDHALVRRVATWERQDTNAAEVGENVFSLMRRIGQAKSGLAADYTAQLARSVGKVVFFAKHVDVMDNAEELFAQRGIRFSSIRGDQTSKTRERNIEAFVNDPDVAVAVCSLTVAGVGLNLQVASDLVLAELSWTDAEQTQAIDRVHRIGQGQPVTAWRIIAAQTIDSKVAELIDSKAGLAARALDGSQGEPIAAADVQLEALVALLTDALSEQLPAGEGPG